MPRSETGFYLFGTNKVYLRSLVIFQCSFEEGKNQEQLLKIERAFEEADGSIMYEETDVDYAIFSRGGTLHLHDLFLSETFGIRVSFLNAKDKVAVLDGKSNAEKPEHILFQSPSDRKEISLLCHIESSLVK